MNSSHHQPIIPRPWRPLGCLILAAASTLAASLPETDAPAKTDFSAYKIISEGNIFNTTRTRRTRGRVDEAPPIRIDTLTLYGTFIYEKGPFAFFTGSSSGYSKVLGPGDSIAGYKIAEITGAGVTLIANTNRVDLRVGMQLRRQDQGEWQIAGGSPALASVSGSSSNSSGDPFSGEMSDVAKRMMKQREQELK